MVSGFALTALTCVDPSGGTSADLANRTAFIDLGVGETVTYTFENTLSVDGVTSFPTDGSDSSAGSIALLAGAVAAVVAIPTAGGWYTRRRWPGNRY